MRRFITTLVMALTVFVGVGHGDVPDPGLFRPRPLPNRPVEPEVFASMKVAPAKGQKDTLCLRLTMTGAGRYEYVVREEAGERIVCSGDGLSDGHAGDVAEVLFPHREISGKEEARYIAEVTIAPLKGNGAAQVIRQNLVVCLIDGSVHVLEELDVPEVL